MFRKLPLIALLLGAVSAWGQSAISAHSGMIHYIEGQVSLDGKPVEVKFAEFPQVQNEQTLATEEGRAEVLLTPGVFLRLSENSSFRMQSNRLSDTTLEVLSGSALFEVAELLPDNAITVHFKDSSIELVKHGLYRMDADAGRLRVYDGEARVTSGQQTVIAKKGREIGFGAVIQTASFNTKVTDPFYRWASRRSENIAVANISSAKSALSSGGGYPSSYGSWAWNPWFGMFTYLPGRGYGYNPFGWMYYSPVTVYYVYYPSNGYGWAGGGAQAAASAPAGYSVTNTGAVALTPDRAGPSSMGSISSGGGGQMSGTAGVASGGASVSRGAEVSGGRR